MVNKEFWKNKKVLITGCTGFKGAWLCLWLQHMGAEVIGFSLAPPTEPNLFTVASVGAEMETFTADVRDYTSILQVITSQEPEIVFHLAAQALVRKSYVDPIETYATNVMGTVNLFEAVRRSEKPVKAIVNVTSDKCYENREWLWGYRENEPMGGFDPYSSSKGCAELITAAWRRSYLEDAGIALATVRSGNVIGGGDWADDRLIPDFLRALDAGQTITIRSPSALRPWQYVFEPLSGYLALAERLFNDGAAYAEAWNFGPEETDSRTVKWIVEYLCSCVPGASWQSDAAQQPHEAHYLKLDSSKARAKLGWKSRWGLGTALDKTLEWHKSWQQGADMRAVSLDQIHTYETTLRPE